MGRPSSAAEVSISDLPVDELGAYARELGLSPDPSTPRGELLRLIRSRQELLVELDRGALLDIVVWARRPVRRSAGTEALVKEIATISRSRFDGLSDAGLAALARLRGVSVKPGEPRPKLERRVRRCVGLLSRVHRKRREVVGSLISRLVEGTAENGDYRFLPEEDGGSLRDNIQNVGVVGGIAQKLRGAADEFIEAKLDEIERRIDSKLDDIDARLGEWRDREIKNRLRIIKITLVSAIIVAIISLGYDYLKTPSDEAGSAAPAAAVQPGGVDGP